MSIKWLGLALVVLLSCGWASAQDEGKPKAIEVIVGADGTIKIIDAKTGKVLGTAQIEKKAEPKTPEEKLREQLRQAELKARKAREDAERQLKLEQKELDRLLQEQQRQLELQRQVEDALRQLEEAQKRTKQIIEAKPPMWGWLPYAGFPEKNAKKPAGNIDQKLDLILKQLGDLRRDVDSINQKLDSKKPVGFHWQIVPGSKPRNDGTIELEIVPAPAKDKKPGGIEFEFELFPAPAKDKKPGAKTQQEEVLEAQRRLERAIREFQEIERKNRQDK